MAEFQSLTVQNKLEEAKSLIKQINEIWYEKLSKFLDTINQKEWAYELVRDKEHKFELALQLGHVEDAYELALAINDTIKLR